MEWNDHATGKFSCLVLSLAHLPFVNMPVHDCVDCYLTTHRGVSSSALIQGITVLASD